MKIPILWT